MRSLSLVSLACFVIACGPPQNEFATEYNDLWCQHVLTCEDPAVLTFNGITTVEDCKERNISEIADWASGCQYQPSAATQCIADMETLSCPTGEPRPNDPPATCDSVYINCTQSAE